MTSTLFLGFVGLMAILVVGVLACYRDERAAFVFTAGLFPWLIYVGLLGYFEVIANTTMRPPGPVFLFVPVVVFLAVFIVRIRSTAGGDFARAFPLWVLLGTQSFRVVVELFIHQLWLEGIVPRVLTFDGANVDVYIGRPRRSSRGCLLGGERGGGSRWLGTGWVCSRWPTSSYELWGRPRVRSISSTPRFPTG